MTVKKLPERPSAADWRPRAREDVRVESVGQELVILDRENEKVHRLNRTASFVWRCCDGTRVVSAIAGELARAFEVEPERAGSDTARLLEELLELGLFDKDGIER